MAAHFAAGYRSETACAEPSVEPLSATTTIATPSPPKALDASDQIVPGVVIDDDSRYVVVHVDARRYLTVRSSGSW